MHPLQDRYRVAAREAVAGHPVSIEALDTPLADLVTVQTAGGHDDPELTRLGAQHLAAVRAAGPVFDGATLAMRRVHDGRILAGHSGYFAMLATCDALRAESEAAAGDRMRRVAEQLAAGDPLHRGDGRSAAIGVSVVVVTPHPHRRLIVGRRAAGMATDAGRWHVVPSGMLEPGEQPLLSCVQRELREETGIDLEVGALRDRLTVLGIAHDLLRLRPDLCLALPLVEETPRIRGGEFDACRAVEFPVSADAVEGWSALTPAAAGAITLAARRYADSPRSHPCRRG